MDDITKAKKPRHRGKLQANLVVNLNKPVDLDALAQIEAAIRRDRQNAIADEVADQETNSVAKKAKTPRQPKEIIHYNVNAGKLKNWGKPAKPAHECAEAMVDAQMGKNAPGSSAAFVGTPGPDAGATGTPVVHGSRFSDFFDVPQEHSRLSEPLTQGRAATSVYDHGVGAGRNPGLAVDHIDLTHQSSPVVSGVRFTTGSHNGDNEFGDRNITHPTGSVTTTGFNAAGESGSFTGMRLPMGLPARMGDHISRDSATPSNGGHSLGNPTSNAVKSSPLDIMRATMRKIG